jgi:hypothetical protein
LDWKNCAQMELQDVLGKEEKGERQKKQDKVIVKALNWAKITLYCHLKWRRSMKKVRKAIKQGIQVVQVYSNSEGIHLKWF